MKYVILTYQFDKPVYFMPHEGPGFSFTTDKKKAKGYSTKKEAQDEADRLSATSPFTVEVAKQ